MMIELIKTLVIKGGIMSGLIAGIVASCIDHKFMDKMTKAEQTHKFDEWQIDEIRELLRDVSMIRIPAVTETMKMLLKMHIIWLLQILKERSHYCIRKRILLYSKAFLIPFMGGMIRCRILD